MNKTPKYVTPGLSPILKKYKTVEGYNVDERGNDVDLLRSIFSIDPLFKNTVWKSIIKNKNVCIHPYDLGLLYSLEYNVDDLLGISMSEDLNNAYLTFEYIDWYKKYNKFLDDKSKYVFLNQLIPAINNVQKTTFIDCDKQFIIFSILSSHFESEFNGFGYGHASICIYDGSKKIGYYIDPMQFEIEKYEGLSKINEINRRKIKKYKVLNVLKTSNPFLQIKDIEIIDTTTPQIIADDYNCLFWSLLLCDIIVKNLRIDEEFKPKLIIRSLLKKYNTKEKLLKVIRRYIGYVYEQAKAVPNSFYKNVLKNTYLEK
jgi:hypothetical protein